MAFHLVSHTFYSAFGREHVRVGRSEEIVVGSRSVWQQGVQFREDRPNVSSTWPAGVYDFDLQGWANVRPSQRPPNLRTKFRAEVGQFAADHLRQWRNASSKE